MNKNMLLALSFLFAFIFQSCHKISGNGPSSTRSYSVKGFTGIDAGLDADIYYTQDSFYSVEVEAQANIHDAMRVEVVGSTLSIGFQKYKNVWNHSNIIVHVTCPNVNKLHLSGSGNIRALQPISTTQMDMDVSGSGAINLAGLDCRSLSIDISGSGNVNVNGGSVTTENIDISGSGKVDLGGVMAKSAYIHTSGSGKSTVWATDYLEVHVSGSGDVYYSGNPSTHTEISGSGKVVHL